MPKPLVIGNWKMNGSLELTSELIHSIESSIDAKISCEVGLCVPFVYIDLARRILTTQQLSIGAQNISAYSGGAYTGEVSAAMLAEFGCRWVLIGHSERRQLFKETDNELVLKLKLAQENDMCAVFCVGETQQERESGKAFSVIERQIKTLLDDDNVCLEKVVFAYEPVWAIGTGLTATPEEAQEVHAFIRDLLRNKIGQSADKIRIIYGGSVKPENAQSLFDQQDINGGLIGGASLDKDAFLSICQNAK